MRLRGRVRKNTGFYPRLLRSPYWDGGALSCDQLFFKALQAHHRNERTQEKRGFHEDRHRLLNHDIIGDPEQTTALCEKAHADIIGLERRPGEHQAPSQWQPIGSPLPGKRTAQQCRQQEEIDQAFIRAAGCHQEAYARQEHHGRRAVLASSRK